MNNHHGEVCNTKMKHDIIGLKDFSELFTSLFMF